MWQKIVNKFKKYNVVPESGLTENLSLEALKKHLAKSKMQIKYINAVGYYDANTILTRDGSLYHVLRFDSFVSRSNLTVALRAFIQKNARYDVAFWIHAVRRKVDKKSPNVPQTGNTFLNDLHEAYQSNNTLKEEFINETYVSIVLAPPAPKESILGGTLFASSSYKYYATHFEKSNAELQQLTKALLTDLAEFSPQQLGIQEDGTCTLYGFLEFLLNPSKEPTAKMIPTAELSKDLLSNYDIGVGFNTIEITEENYTDNSKKKALEWYFPLKKAVAI